MARTILHEFDETSIRTFRGWMYLVEYFTDTVKDRPGHDFRYAINCSKIKFELGWKPDHTFEEGLRETVLWYLANSEWVEHVQSGAYRDWIRSNYAERM